MALRDWRVRVAFDRDEATLAVENELSATDRAIRAHGTCDLGFVVARTERAGRRAHRLAPCAIAAARDLLHNRPARQKFLQHSDMLVREVRGPRCEVRGARCEVRLPRRSGEGRASAFRLRAKRFGGPP